MVQDIYFAHTCAHEGAKSVASMMFKIWTQYESELAQVHRIRSGSNAPSKVAEW